MTVTVVSPYLSIKIYSFSCIFIFVCAQSLSCVLLFETPWIVALQAPLSMEFSRENTCGVAISSSRGSSWPGNQTQVSASPVLADGFLTTEPPGRPIFIFTFHLIHIITIWVVNGTASILYTCVCVCVCVCVCIY